MKDKYKLDVRNKYLFSYLTGSIIPILLLSLVYLYTSTVRLKQNINASMVDKLDLIKNNIDLQIKNMESSSMHFSSNLKLIDNYKLNRVNEISSQLILYKENYPFVEDVLFHIRGDENIFNTSKVMPYYRFEEELGDKVNLNMTQFYKNINSLMSSRLIPTKLNYPYSLNTGKYLIYMHPVPFLDTSPQGTIAFLIDKKKFEDITTNYMGEYTGYICIYDPAMNAIFEDSNNLDVSSDIKSHLQGLKGVDITNQIFNGKKYVAVRDISENSGYTYILLMPYDKFYSSLWAEFNFFSLVSVIIIILAIVMAIFLTMRLYAPIKRLINDMLIPSASKQDIEANSKSDVFERIRYEFKNILTRNNELLLQVGSQRSLVREQLLTSLLCGNFKNQGNLELSMKCANVSFDYNFFFILYIRFIEKSNHLGGSITNYLDQVYFKDGKAYGVELEDGSGYAVIVNASLSVNQKPEDLRKNTASMFNNMLAQYGYTDLLIGVGGICSDVYNIDLSFIEAEKATNEAAVDNVNITLYSVSSKKNNIGFMQPASEKAVYYQSLLKGNSDAASAILDTMFHNMEGHTHSFVKIRSFCFYVFNTIVEAANIVGLDISENDIAKSAAFSSLDEFKKCAVDSTKEICNYVLQQQTAKSEQLKNKIIDYVSVNFSEYDISIDKLADIFNLSQSYLGKFFKNETGYNFMQYITMLRMDYIKRKLVTSDIPIKEIVQSAGYVDTSNFIRKFKNSEGMTPGQFREMSSKLKQPEINSI